MKIYRIENILYGKDLKKELNIHSPMLPTVMSGPYNSSGLLSNDLKNHYSTFLMEYPGMIDDLPFGKRGNIHAILTGRVLSGFEEISHLFSWFGGLLPLLFEDGCSVVEYEVSENISSVSGKQCFFYIEKTINRTVLENKFENA